MLLDQIALQLSLLLISIFFIRSSNILTLWCCAGLFLIVLGFILFYHEAGILVGFLWVIDLGVGLVFFIFILHWSTFLYQHHFTDKSLHLMVFAWWATPLYATFFFFMHLDEVRPYSAKFINAWYYNVSLYDYYDLFYSYIVTDLNLLKEIYFSADAAQFFIINFVLFYGIIASILFTFLAKKVFTLLSFLQILFLPNLSTMGAVYFIRLQDFIAQQLTSSGIRDWSNLNLKKKN